MGNKIELQTLDSFSLSIGVEPDLYCENCNGKLNVYADTISGTFKHELVRCPICRHEFFLTGEDKIEYIIEG